MGKCGLYDHNLYGPMAAVAAYTHGAPWLDALRRYLRGNFELVDNVITSYSIHYTKLYEEMFESLFDQAVAEAGAAQNDNGIGLSLYRHFLSILGNAPEGQGAEP